MLDFFADPPKRGRRKPLSHIVIDSLIIAGVSFAASLPGDRLPTLVDSYIAFKAFLYSFFLQLAIDAVWRKKG